MYILIRIKINQIEDMYDQEIPLTKGLLRGPSMKFYSSTEQAVK